MTFTTEPTAPARHLYASARSHVPEPNITSRLRSRAISFYVFHSLQPAVAELSKTRQRMALRMPVGLNLGVVNVDGP